MNKYFLLKTLTLLIKCEHKGTERRASCITIRRLITAENWKGRSLRGGISDISNWTPKSDHIHNKSHSHDTHSSNSLWGTAQPLINMSEDVELVNSLAWMYLNCVFNQLHFWKTAGSKRKLKLWTYLKKQLDSSWSFLTLSVKPECIPTACLRYTSSFKLKEQPQWGRCMLQTHSKNAMHQSHV